MKVRLGKFAYAVAFALVVTYAVMTLTGPAGLASLFEKERRILAAEKRNAALEKDIQQTKDRIQRLGADQAEQERVVQERLNLVHPGEKVFMLPDSPKK